MNQFLLKYKADYCFTAYMLVQAPTYNDAVDRLKRHDQSAHDIASATLRSTE